MSKQILMPVGGSEWMVSKSDNGAYMEIYHHHEGDTFYHQAGPCSLNPISKWYCNYCKKIMDKELEEIALVTYHLMK